MTEKIKYKISFSICLLAVIGSLVQISLGAEYSPTGEQLSGGLPVSSLILFISGLILVFLNFKKTEFPGINIFQIVLIIALSGSLLGLSGVSKKQAIKELIQVYEIFLFAYLVFVINRDLLLDVLKRSAVYIIILLLLLHVFNLNTQLPFYLSDTKLEAFIVLLTPFIFLQTGSLVRKIALLTLIAIFSGSCFTNGGLLLIFVVVFILSSSFLGDRKIYFTALALFTMIFSFFPLNHQLAWDSLNPNYDSTHPKRLFIEYAASQKAPAYFPLGIGPGSYKKGINYLKKTQPLLPHKDDLKIPQDSNSQYQIFLVESGIIAVLAFFGLLIFLWYLAWKKEDYNDKCLSFILVFALGFSSLFCVVFSKGIGIFAGAILALCSAKRFSENEKTLYPAIAVMASLMFALIFLLTGKSFDNNFHQSPYNCFLVKTLTDLPHATERQHLKIIASDKNADEPTVITIEAEDAKEVKRNFKIVPANDSSGDRIIESPNDSGKGVGKAVYEIKIPEDGQYRLFARVWWEDGCSNSMAVKIDDLPKVVLANEIFKRWQVIEAVKPISLPKGKCKLTIIPLEDGIKIDTLGLILLTKKEQN